MSLHSPERNRHELWRLSRRAMLGAAAALAISPLCAIAECPCDVEAEIENNQPATRPADNPAAVLEVCADPNNLPFSNRDHQGFEDKIAQLVADELRLTLKYIWLPQRLGFYRTALKTFDAGLVMAAPAGFEKALVTRPYYRSSYVFVHKKDRSAPRSLDDPALRSAKIGVQLTGGDNTPPTHGLAKRKLIDNVIGFPVFDESEGRPGERIIKAVATSEVDFAIAWGPQAGYFAKQQSVPLAVTLLTPQQDLQGDISLPFTFAICMAVRRSDTTLRDTINSVIVKRQADINHVLDEYAVPRLDIVK